MVIDKQHFSLDNVVLWTCYRFQSVIAKKGVSTTSEKSTFYTLIKLDPEQRCGEDDGH